MRVSLQQDFWKDINTRWGSCGGDRNDLEASSLSPKVPGLEGSEHSSGAVCGTFVYVISNDLGLLTVWWHQNVLAFLMEAQSFESIYRGEGQNVEPFMTSLMPVGQRSCSREKQGHSPRHPEDCALAWTTITWLHHITCGVRGDVVWGDTHI